MWSKQHGQHIWDIGSLITVYKGIITGKRGIKGDSPNISVVHETFMEGTSWLIINVVQVS